MKITGIRQQVKRADRYSVFVDEKYSFSLSEAALLDSGITSGQELTAQQIVDYKQLSADDRVYHRALRYIAMRPRSTQEMVRYLQRHEAPEALAQSIIHKMSDLGLLDDASYAATFVRDRQLLRPTSRRKLALELKKRGIADEHARAALEQGEVSEKDSLRSVIAKKRRQTKYRDDEKLMQYLARQGFSYSDIKDALAKEQDY